MKDFLSITVDDELDFSSVSERKDKFILLNEGYYSFRVLGVNMDRYQGSENSKSCPVAKLLLSIENDKGNVVLNHFFFLNNSSTQQIADFLSQSVSRLQAVAIPIGMQPSVSAAAAI